MQGEALSKCTVSRVGVAQCLQWHPEKKIVAVGWDSGEVTTVYVMDKKSEVHEMSIHKTPITVLSWNHTGSRLVTGDEVKTCYIYSYMAAGFLGLLLFDKLILWDICMCVCMYMYVCM